MTLVNYDEIYPMLLVPYKVGSKHFHTIGYTYCEKLEEWCDSLPHAVLCGLVVLPFLTVDRCKCVEDFILGNC